MSWQDHYLQEVMYQQVTEVLTEIKDELRPLFIDMVRAEMNARIDEVRGPKGDDGDTPVIDYARIVSDTMARLQLPTAKQIAAEITIPKTNEERIARKAATLAREMMAASMEHIDMDVLEAKLLEKLTPEEREETPKSITVSDVEGLDKTIRNLERMVRDAIREHGGGARGGGMSTPQHESFVVDSTTTQLVTSYRVAANGRAIWMYYNGAEIFRNRHYTAPSDQRTFPLLFVPDDPIPGQNNTIDVLYFRT